MTTKKKLAQKGKRQFPRTDIDDDLESDTPISEVSRKNNVPESIDERTVVTDDQFDQGSLMGVRVAPKKSTYLFLNLWFYLWLEVSDFSYIK